MKSLSNVSFDECTDSKVSSLSAQGEKKGDDSNGEITVLEFYIYEGERYIGWDCFNKEKVLVGKSEEADLVLKGRNISDIHAYFYIKGGNILLSDGNTGSGVIVNGKFISECMLKSFDCVTIGTYTLKIKMRKNVRENVKQNPQNKVLEEDSCLKTEEKYNELDEMYPGMKDKAIDDSQDESACQETPEEDFKESTKESKLEDYTSLEKSLESEKSIGNLKEEAEEFEDTTLFSEATGEDSTLFSETSEEDIPAQNEYIENEYIEDKIIEDEINYSQTAENEMNKVTVPSQEERSEISALDYYQDKEQKDEDNQQKEKEFFLRKEKIIPFMDSEVYQAKGKAVLEIVKCRGNSIIDISFLNRKEKYYIMSVHGRFCLAENKDSEISYFYYNDQLEGKVQFFDFSHIALNDLRVQENFFNKRKGIYRRLIPIVGLVTISIGYYEYYLRMALPEQSQELTEYIEKNTTLIGKIKKFFSLIY